MSVVISPHRARPCPKGDGNGHAQYVNTMHSSDHDATCHDYSHSVVTHSPTHSLTFFCRQICRLWSTPHPWRPRSGTAPALPRASVDVSVSVCPTARGFPYSKMSFVCFLLNDSAYLLPSHPVTSWPTCARVPLPVLAHVPPVPDVVLVRTLWNLVLISCSHRRAKA